MRPVSGEDLVTAALRSSLARAQKNYGKFSYQKLKQDFSGEERKSLKSINRKEGVGGSFKKGNRCIKFQSDFDIWKDQTSSFTFVSEGYTNGASVPDGIECLNNISASSLRKKSDSFSTVSLLNGRSGGGSRGIENFSGTCAKKSPGSGATRDGKVALESDQAGKNAVTATENPLELLKRLKENRKEKKKLAKLRKRLVKEGHSVEETEALIRQARNSKVGGGAILKLGANTNLNREANSPKEQQQQLVLEKKNFKMKDMFENGNSRPAASSTNGPRPNTPPTQQRQSLGCASSSQAMINGGGGNSGNSQHQLPQPKRVLYPREKIVPGYRDQDQLPVGAGFFNMGNSCYLNASLQAVFHVPAFINWLRSDIEHRKHCQDNVNCIVCAMKKTFESAMSRHSLSNSAIRPVEIINRLRAICRHFSHGRQEDAHEFLRYLFESMERSYLAAINCLRLDNRSKETNPLGQIFGGYLRTEVTCLKCHYVSTTFQPTAELQLDIRHHTTLEDAIENHFKKERLDNNDYKCEKCRTISQATKQFSLEVPPIVLCLQLKRFTLYGTKIAKRIHCNQILDMSKFMHKSKRQLNGFTNLRYRLVALVTHLGSSPNCGHYTAIAQAADGNFYQFDDSYVHQVTVPTALNNDAYVIIYEVDTKSTKSPESPKKTAANSGFTSNLTGLGATNSSPINTLFPKKLPSTTIPKIAPHTSKLVRSSEIEGKSGSASSSSVSMNGRASASSSTNTSNGGLRLNPDQDRKLVSFGIRTITPNKITVLKPGVSLTNSSKLGIQSNSGSSSSTISQSPLIQRDKIKLVPYNDDENEESDKDEHARGASSPEKRLNSPQNRSKESPKRSSSSNSLPITPPKSPKLPSSANGLASPSLGNSFKKEKEQVPELEKSTSSDLAVFSKSTEAKLALQSKDSNNKRKTSEEREPFNRKSRSQKRRSSSSSSSESRSSSTEREKSNQNKRKREEPSSSRSSAERRSSHHSSSSSDHKRDRDHNRDSYSQERERERRRNRNPSPSRSKSRSPDSRDKRSTNEHNQKLSSTVESFDVSRLSEDNSIKSWNGQKSVLSRSMDEDRKRANDKTADDEYNDDFDQGRTKKVRRSLSLPRETERTGDSNRFQAVEDRKKEVNQWSSIANRKSNGSSDSKSWTSEDDSRRSFPPRSGNNGTNGYRPRHSSSNGSFSSPGQNYSRNGHGRSPFRNGHRSNNGGNHYRSQSHNPYHNNNGNRHWNSDRNRH